MGRISAKAGKSKQSQKNTEIPIDKVSRKKPRGRPPKIQPSWVRGRADNYRYTFGLIWPHIWPGLSTAQTQRDVIQSLTRQEVGPYALELIQMADLILQVVRDPKFPKRQRQAQINFMADSIGGHGLVTPRRSRDICERERARIERVYQILRYEYYVECSCGYKGVSRNHACAQCEAQIPLNADSSFDNDLND
jgi:hypothetical protein